MGFGREILNLIAITFPASRPVIVATCATAQEQPPWGCARHGSSEASLVETGLSEESVSLATLCPRAEESRGAEMHGEDARSGASVLPFKVSFAGGPRRAMAATKRQTGEVRCGEEGAERASSIGIRGRMARRKNASIEFMSSLQRGFPLAPPS